MRHQIIISDNIYIYNGIYIIRYNKYDYSRSVVAEAYAPASRCYSRKIIQNAAPLRLRAKVYHI